MSGENGNGGDAGGGANEGGGARSTGEMTLAFTLAAIERFEDPETVFADAREWSRYVGIVGNDADAVGAFVDEHDLTQEFDLGDADKWLAMEQLRGSTATPRHVFVGTTVEDRRIANHLDWEYRRPEDVAEKADWNLTGESSDAGGAGFVDRLRSLLPGGSA